MDYYCYQELVADEQLPRAGGEKRASWPCPKQCPWIWKFQLVSFNENINIMKAVKKSNN